jgi:hypothetical protein
MTEELMKPDDVQTLTSADAGVLAVEKEPEERPESVTEYVQRITTVVANTREWAKVKLATIERKLEDSGGDPKAELANAIAALRREISRS